MALFSVGNSSDAGLDVYLDRVRRRLRASLASRGLGALALTALLATVCGVYAANKLAFSTAGMIGARTLLLVSAAAVIVMLLVRPLRGLGARRAADEAERRSPAFGGRLDAWVDQTARMRRAGAPASPLLDLLQEDTLRVAESVPVDDVVGRGRILSFAAAAVAAAAALVWLGSSGPGYWQYGASRLWTGWFAAGDAPLYEIAVEPGDTTVRRGANLTVAARPLGFDPAGVDIYAKFESSVDWEKAPMRPQLEGSGYEFTFSAVREPLRYYMVSGRVRTSPFNVDVVVMPNVENIVLEYEFPAWTGLDPLTEDPGGDIRAVKGTKVKVAVATDKPLQEGILAVGEKRIALRGARAEIEVAEDGEYHVAAIYRGEDIRLTDDFFITVVPDEKPELDIVEPSRDWRATGIEEVAASFKAADDFGLRSLELHYSVNGAAQPKISFDGVRGKKEFQASRLFALEEMGGAPRGETPPPAGGGALPPPAPPAGLVPGDLISYYAAASDGRNETRTDIYFIEVQPFDRSFSQSQQAGGGGQGGGQQRDEISRRQKEIIVATWNLIKERDAGGGRKPKELREGAEMLAELQATLMSQAATLAERTRARQLTESDPKFKQFVEYMEKAAEFMKPAADALAAYELDDAVGPEQQALQFLLRAESIFTDIQISMNRNGGGGGGGASRDLAEMFELEMDLEKNQYETGGGSSGQQIEQEIDDAFKKLEELARRQEQLADRARGRQEMAFEERWKQEMLRREAEELKRRLEQLQRRQQGQRQGSSAQQSQASSSASGSSPGSSGGGQGRPQQQQLERTIRQLDRAARDMEQSNRNGGQSGQSALRAQQQLRQALQEMSQERRRQSRNAIARMRQNAEQLVQEQQQAEQRLQQSLETALAAIKAQGGRQQGLPPTGMTREEEIALAERKAAMGERLAGIEREMQSQSRRLREGNRAASDKLRSALGDLQQSEAATSILNASDMIRRGMAPYVAQGERGVSQALRRLRDDLMQVEQLAQGEGGDRRLGLARALHDMENLRRRMEEAAGLGESGPGESGQRQQERQGPQGNGRQPGNPSGQGQSAQGQSGQGQSGQGRQADRADGPGAPSENASPRSRQAAGGPGGNRRNDLGGSGGPRGAVNYGNWSPRSHRGAADPEIRRRMEEGLRQGVADVPRIVNQLRQSGQFDPQDFTELRNFVRGLASERFQGNPELIEQEYRKMLALLEQLEVQVRRQVELDDKEEVRAIVSEPAPETYREAVAEYYRRLSAN